MPPTTHPVRQSEKTGACIVGSGFSGIAMAIALEKRGISDYVILERGSDLGGVWRDNIYPGCASDVPSVLYSYSYETDYPWSGSYPSQHEILDYLKYCADRHGVTGHIRYDQEVVSADYDDAEGTWRVGTAGELELECQLLIPAIGIFNSPVVPTLEGVAEFDGQCFHSAQWPSTADLAGKRVGVVGTGASAIQIVPEIVREASQVHVFQRSAPYVLPKFAVDVSQRASERRRVFDLLEEISQRRSDKSRTLDAEQQFKTYLEDQVPDAQLRARLTPNYPLGCKRTLFSNGWYEALQRDNVEVVVDDIQRIGIDVIVTKDGTSRLLDAIVFATGFEPSRYLGDIEVVGRDGRRLADAWSEGAQAYLGISVAGFPNFFILYGPNTNVAGSIVYMIECQAEYIADCVERIRKEQSRSIEVRADVMEIYNDELQTKFESTFMGQQFCQSYYQTAGGRIVTNFPGTQIHYKELTDHVEFSNFVIT